jgi:hypothetical protein
MLFTSAIIKILTSQLSIMSADPLVDLGIYYLKFFLSFYFCYFKCQAKFEITF